MRSPEDAGSNGVRGACVGDTVALAPGRHGNMVPEAGVQVREGHGGWVLGSEGLEILWHQ